LLPGISTLENVMLPAYPLGPPRPALVRRARSLLERFGLGARVHARADRLSGGEAQRVAIARALVNDPEIVIADEPTAHLDTARSIEFMEIVRDLRAAGKTVVIGSHDPVVFDAPVVDATLRMRDGRLSGASP
jgi:putative ABC transport system ATP-binding protein